MAVQVTPLAQILPQPSTQGFEILGQIAWWDIASIRIDKDIFQTAWNDANLPEHEFTRTTLQEATNRGIEDWLDQRRATYGLGKKSSSGTVGDDKRSLIRTINQAGAEWVVFVIVTEKADMAGLGLSHVSAMRILMRKKDGALVVTFTASGAPDDVNNEIALRHEIDILRQPYFGTVLGASVSNGIRSVLKKMGGVCVRRDGGVYFMPPNERPAMTRMGEVLDASGGILTTLDIPNTAAHKSEMVRNITVGLAGEIAAAKAKIEALDEKSRVKTIQAELAGLGDLGTKVDAYSTFLQLQSESLTSKIADLRTTVGGMLTAKGVEF